MHGFLQAGHSLRNSVKKKVLQLRINYVIENQYFNPRQAKLYFDSEQLKKNEN
jgi:hypothetical protein